MSGIVVYRSSYGSTEQYAEWIGEETGYTVHDIREKAIPWERADTVVIGSPILANKPVLAGWMKANWDRMKAKRVVLFTTSGADPAVAPAQEWAESPFSEEMRTTIRFFPLAGRFDYASLSGLHKAMIWFAAVVLRNKDVKYQMKNPVDGVAKQNLTPLLESLRPSA